MKVDATAAVEEYLETIYRLQQKTATARTNDIVDMLNVVPGTVTNTMKRLQRDGYVRHTPYKGVRLTAKGRRIALHVIRKHRLSERLLTDILHVDWDKVHDAACKLEHAIGNDIVDPLDEALRHPKTCPHGNPIPTKHGNIVEEESYPLTGIDPGTQVTIVRVTEENPELLHYLATLGLVPGASVVVVEKAPFQGPISLRVGAITRAISEALASIIRAKHMK
jgi:DtxR family Mn-dependent transcriptional regulator